MTAGDEELRARVLCAARRWRPDVSAVTLGPLDGGASSTTYSLTMSLGPVPVPAVLKVAPAGLPPTGARDVLRQARVLTELAGEAAVPVPDVLFTSARSAAPGPPFFAMRHCQGESYEPVFSELADPGAAALVGSRARAAVHVLAGLHAIRTDRLRTLPQADVVGLAAEVERWQRALGTVPDDILTAESCATAAAGLLASVPGAARPSLVHGDYRLGNLLFSGAVVTAVLDWEIWSVSDPRCDLAWLLMLCNPDDVPFAPGHELGLPPVASLVRAYQDVAVGPDVHEMTWFRALAHYKYAAIMGLILKRTRGADATQWTRRQARSQVMLAAVASIIAGDSGGGYPPDTL